jgi:hypothetical protein
LNNKKAFKAHSADKSMGREIKVINGDEIFVVYPKYGGSLQAFSKKGVEIIPHSLPCFLKKNNFLPGGYRSFTGVGGFRPIWAFGSHHNPCILWQNAFAWNLNEGKKKIEIQLSRKMYHADISYKIIVQKGASGFIFEAKALNKIENAYGTFCFNLPLAISLASLNEIVFEWNKESFNLAEIRDNFFKLPVKEKLDVKLNGLNLEIETDKQKTAGFYTAWSSDYVTPDLRGMYKKLKANEEYSARWKFSLS